MTSQTICAARLSGEATQGSRRRLYAKMADDELRKQAEWKPLSGTSTAALTSNQVRSTGPRLIDHNTPRRTASKINGNKAVQS
jgi:hypothetical protein